MSSPISMGWVYATAKVQNEWNEYGTGFLVLRKIDETLGRVFLVTNKHVVNADKQRRDSAQWLQLFVNVKGKDGALAGRSFKVPLKDQGRSLIREHPNDHVDVLAVDVTALINTQSDLEKRWAVYEEFATSDVLKNEDITIGEEILVLGYPMGLTHARTNAPLVRQGIVATNIGEAIDLEVTNPDGSKSKVEVPAFLIDAAVVPGSSGSPVVLKPVVGRVVHGSVMLGSTRPYLLGILSATEITSIALPSGAFPALAGLGVVYDANTVRETVELFFK